MPAWGRLACVAPGSHRPDAETAAGEEPRLQARAPPITAPGPSPRLAARLGRAWRAGKLARVRPPPARRWGPPSPSHASLLVAAPAVGRAWPTRSAVSYGPAVSEADALRGAVPAGPPPQSVIARSVYERRPPALGEDQEDDSMTQAIEAGQHICHMGPRPTYA